MLVLLIGLVVLVLMVLALGWDGANWFLGHRALDNLADGAAVAAANEVDADAWYASGGRRVELLAGQAESTVRSYLADVAGDSGLRAVALDSVRVERPPGDPRGLGPPVPGRPPGDPRAPRQPGAPGPAGPRVTVEIRAATPVAFLRYLHLVPPAIRGRASAAAELVPP